MNWIRVLVGGVAAGFVMLVSQIVLHTVVLAEQGTALIEDWAARGLDASAALEPSIPLTAGIFMLGGVAVWLYAGLRSRFGPGPRTALCVGLVVWAASYLYTAVYIHAGVVIRPPRMVWLPAAWGFFEVPLATLAGAWLYRE